MELRTKLLWIILTVLGVSTSFGQTVLLSEDFNSLSTGDVSTNTADAVYQDVSANSGSGCDASSGFRISSSFAGGTNYPTGSSGNMLIIDYDFSCTQDAYAILGNFTAGSSDIEVEFTYNYRDNSSNDRFDVYLYNETQGAFGPTLLSLTSSNDEEFSTTVSTLTSGDEYSIRFRYRGSNDWGLTIDNVVVTALCPSATFTKENCNPDLTYNLTVEVTDLQGFSNLKVVDEGNNDIITGINSATDYTATSLTGDHTYTLTSQDGFCTTDTLIEGCNECDLLVVSFGSQNCQSDLSYDIDIVISNLSTNQEVTISDGITTYFNVSSTGTYTVTNITQSTTLHVTDKDDNTCVKSHSYTACKPCDLTVKPTDEPCDAPLLDLSQPFVGATSCGYTPTSNSPGGCGSIELDSWFKFIPSATEIEIEYNVTDDPDDDTRDCNTFSGNEGIQTVIFDGSVSCPSNSMSFDDVSGSCENTAWGTGTWAFSGVEIGKEYYIRVDGYGGQKCIYSFEPISGLAESHPNDKIGQAEELICGSIDTADIILATASDAPLECDGFTRTAKGMWYKFTGSGSNTTIHTDNPYTNFDTKIHVYTGDSTNVDGLTCVGEDDNGGLVNIGTSSLNVATVLNQEYYIYVEGSNGEEGAFVISLECCGIVASIDNDKNDTICAGEEITYTVTGAADNYDFMVDGVSVQDGASATYSSTTITDGQLVSVMVTQGSCSAGIVDDTTRVITYNPQLNNTMNDSICAGESITYYVSGGGSSFDFYVEGILVQSGTDTFYTTNTINDGDVLTVLASNGNCSDSLIADTLRRKVQLSADLSFNDVDSTICLGDNIIFTAGTGNIDSFDFRINNISAQHDVINTYNTSSLQDGNNVIGLIVTGENACPDTATAKIVVNSAGTLNFTMSPNDPSICEGDSVTFSITPNGETNYEFFLNGVSEQSSNVNTYGHSGLVDNDEVSVEVTFTNGCAAMSDTITMTVDDTVDAVISVTDGNTHCSEAEVEINASPTGIGATYDFFLNGENVQSGSNTVLTGAYTVDQNIQLDITTTDGCTSSTTDFITINTTPDVDLNNSTSNDSICAGGSVSFTAAGNADNYNFFKNDVSVQNTASDTYLDNTISDGDEFYVIASSNGCHDTTSITTIGLSTGITATLNSGHAGNLICDGFAMTFTGNGGDNFTFFYNNVQVQDGTDNTYDIANPQDQDEISLIVTSGLCADTVENQIITVADTPVAAISMTTDSICLGQCVTYTASGGTSYQFILNNTDTLGALSATSSIELCDLDNNDRMTLIASNGTCTDLTYSGLIEVAPNPDIELTLRDSAICQGEQAVLDVTSNGERFEYFTDNISDYVGTDDSRVYNNLNNGQELKVTARLGHCYTTDSISIIVHDLPEVALSQNQVCTGQQVEITENRNGSGTMDFVFGINGTDFSSTQDNIFLPSNGSVDNGDRVHVIVSNAHCSNFDTIILVLDSINTTLTSTELDLEICTGTPVNFNATGGSTYTFYVNGVDMQGPSISPTYGTTTLQNGDIISVEVEASNGCSNTETLAPFTVHQYDNANFSYPADTLCNIGNASPTLEGINTTGSWSSIPSVGLTLHNSRGDISLDRSEPATYTIIYTTDGECPDADTAQVNIVEAPSQPYAGEDQVLCNTNSITLNADYLDVGTGTWTISNGTGNISNPNNELTTVSDLTVGDTTTLVWTSFSSVHCPTYSDEINITIIDADIVIEAGENILCYDSIITLDATAPTIANTGTWTSASGNITFTDDHDPNTSIIGMEPNVNETITWSILDTFCNITGSDDLTIFNQLTEFNISPEKEDELILLELDFMLSDFDSLTSWTWYIDGEEVATGGSSISHTFYEPGAHEVIVNGIDTKGCSTSRTIIYNSEEGDELFIPTSFTPDGETNNIFAPTGHLIHYSEYSFKIFNRWGQMVYESYVPHEGWDGTFRNSGTLLPMDGYSYMLVLTDSQGNQTLRKGTIVLIR